MTAISSADIPPLATRVERLEVVIDGDHRTDTPGVRVRVATVEQTLLAHAKILEDLTDSRKFWLAMAGVAVAAITGLTSMVVNLILLFRGTP